MRKATDIKVKRSRIGESYSNVVIPEEGDIINFGEDGIFQVHNVKVYNNAPMHNAEFVLDTMDGSTTIKINISSFKPFRDK